MAAPGMSKFVCSWSCFLFYQFLSSICACYSITTCCNGISREEAMDDEGKVLAWSYTDSRCRRCVSLDDLSK